MTAAVEPRAGRAPNTSGDVQTVRPEPLAEALRQGHLGTFQAISPFAACLMPMLTALGWQGDPRHIVEALPHFAADLDLDGLRNVLVELSYVTRPEPKRLGDLDSRLFPCLHVDRHGIPRVAIERRTDGILVFDGARREERLLKSLSPHGTAYLIEVVQPARDEAALQGTFLSAMIRRFRRIGGQLALITLFSNILALGFPLFALMVYDCVIAGDARALLFDLALGIGMVFLFDFVLRMVRARMLGYLGARIERLVAVSVLKQILHLPVGYTEGLPVGTQLARLREFESVREFFTGPLAGIALDLPFVIVFLAAIAVLGGPLVLAPLVLGATILLVGGVARLLQKGAIQRAAGSRTARHGLTVEIVSSLRLIKQTGSSDIWLERYRAASAAAATHNRHVQFLSGAMGAVSQGLIMLTGALVLSWGALRIMDGTMSVGALVATMVLSWRALAPLQLGIVALARLEHIRLGMVQIDRLLKLPPELSDRVAPSVVQRVFRGAVTLNRVSLRYRPNAEPALLGVDLALKPGETVGIAGHSGSGKSTILKVMAGLYQPQAGAILLDGLDIRQMTPHELRTAVSYMPQNCQLFHGTIRQNLRLAAPTATEDELKAALAEAGVLDAVMLLPQGLQTGLGDFPAGALPTGLLQRIALARVYLRASTVLLLDEPGQWLDESGDAALIAALRRRKGSQTIVIATHRLSHLAICDRIVVLENGRVARIRTAPGDGKAVSRGAMR